jgi:glycosyltransferase involved in cell wall biosynthesis
MSEQMPAISCILPTIGRRKAFVGKAVDLFLRQTYPCKELVVVDEVDSRNGTTCAPAIPIHPDIRYVLLDKLHGGEITVTIGAKRNLACALARGDYIAFWDDDDWYGEDRLARQVAPLLTGDADISGLTMDAVFHLPAWRMWRCSQQLQREIFQMGVHGGTLLFRKGLWGSHAAFKNISSGEDGAFLRQVVEQGARLVQIPNDGDFVYIRHESDWPLPPNNQYPSMHQWQEVPPIGGLPPADLMFYAGLVPALR